jgi:putative membrane protein
MKMSNAKRLHPIAVISTVLKQLKEMIFPILAVTVFGRNGSEWGIFSIAAPLAILVFVLVKGILSWYRFTYRVEENELRIESGVFVRKKRYIPFERIQSIDQSEGLIHRAFNLVKLKVETAAPGAGGKEDAEAVLSAISKEEAKRFQEIVTAVKKPSAVVEEECAQEQTIIYKISTTELILLAITSGGVGVIFSALVAFLSQFDDMIPFKRVFHQFENFLASGFVFISLMVLIGFLVVWLIALVGTLFKYANFTVTKTADDLVITRGIIEKRKITIPLKRIQAIRITQSMLRQPLGYGAVYFENAGGSVTNGELASVVILPIAKRKDIWQILSMLLPDYHFNNDYHPAPKRALIRYLLKGWIIFLPILLVPAFLLKPFGWLFLLLLFPVTYLQYISYQDAGWMIHQDQLSLRYRQLNKHEVFVKKGKIQSLRLDEGYFQKQKKLSTIDAEVKCGNGAAGGRVVDVDQEHAAEILKWFSFEKGNN